MTTAIALTYFAGFAGFVATMAALYARRADRNGWRRV